eukprot:2991020-Pyramimonas_sp.AAC.1
MVLCAPPSSRAALGTFQMPAGKMGATGDSSTRSKWIRIEKATKPDSSSCSCWAVLAASAAAGI